MTYRADRSLHNQSNHDRSVDQLHLCPVSAAIFGAPRMARESYLDRIPTSRTFGDSAGETVQPCRRL